MTDTISAERPLEITPIESHDITYKMLQQELDKPWYLDVVVLHGLTMVIVLLTFLVLLIRVS